MKAERVYDNLKAVKDFACIKNSKFSLNSDVFYIGTGKNKFYIKKSASEKLFQSQEKFHLTPFVEN